MTTNAPVTRIRDGFLRATVWRNKGPKGEFLSIRFSRTFRDDKGGYGDSDSFRHGDLLQLAHLAMRAYEETTILRAEQRNAVVQQPDDGRVA